MQLPSLDCRHGGLNILGLTIILKSLSLKRDGTMYNIKFGTPMLKAPESLPIFDRIVESFRFVDSSGVQQPQTNQKTTSGSMGSELNAQPQVPNSNFLMPPLSAHQVQTSSNDTSLRILSQYGYVEPNQISNGILHVIGEVINESNQTARFIRVVATFYDQNKQVIGTDYSYTTLSELSPGQKSPFEISLSGTSAPIHQMQDYALALDWSK